MKMNPRIEQKMRYEAEPETARKNLPDLFLSLLILILTGGICALMVIADFWE